MLNSPPSRAEFDELRAMLESLAATNTELRAENQALRAENARLAAQLTELRAQHEVVVAKLDESERQLALLRKKQFGSTSEKGGQKPTKAPRPKNDEGAQDRRREGRDERKKMSARTIDHALAEGERTTCSTCGKEAMRSMEPETSVEYEWVPGRLERRIHRRETAMCTCCRAFVRAPAPVRVVDGGQYGPGFMSRIVVHKLLDCVPLYRQAKMFERDGLRISRSTLVDLFHLAASLIKPIYDRMLVRVAEARVVHADETTLKMQRETKKGWVWTFITTLYIAYLYRASRSGDAPRDVLGDSSGVLVVDGYTGYNNVTTPERRIRAGCNSHSRRKFVEANSPLVEVLIDHYKEVFAVEAEARSLGIFGTPADLELRRARAGPAMRAIKAWCDEQDGNHAPKSGLGIAIRYLINQWEYLTRFLDDVEVDPTNNLSEREIRIVALGRKNYLFVGHEEAGQNAAMLTSLAQTCVLHDVDPQAYLADVLLRVQHHPNSELDDLLPHRWKERFASRQD